MKVAAVTPGEAASDPLHPDHDRWVKETTLKMEVEHAQKLGGTLRDAEAENARLLARMEALAREAKPVHQRNVPRKSRAERMLDRAVSVKHAMPKPNMWLASSPCGRCGLCRGCKREKRVLAIGHLATKQKDPWAMQSMWGISLLLLRIQAGSGEFKGVSKSAAQKRLVAAVEKVCDESVKKLGAWL